MAHGPLQGVKVVSCSTAQAGTVPYMLMADLGADVIKIETPKGGDPSRRMTVLPGKGSTFFETNNRGVKSVTLNLKEQEGRDILKKLVADVLDRVDQFPDFDPRRHYALTLSAGELSAEERNSAILSMAGSGAPPASASDIDLDLP